MPGFSQSSLFQIELSLLIMLEGESIIGVLCAFLFAMQSVGTRAQWKRRKPSELRGLPPPPSCCVYH